VKIGDLVKLKGEMLIGIIIGWDIVYDRFGDPVEKYASVKWQGSIPIDSENPDMLEVINENR
tara:strand:- start:739 stop:924 length:186 start_codon:yes stop_codon:yes gene_type:complete